jgi:hypothetical protein
MATQKPAFLLQPYQRAQIQSKQRVQKGVIVTNVKFIDDPYIEPAIISDEAIITIVDQQRGFILVDSSDFYLKYS